MANAPKSARVLRFGVFEVDLRAGELRKDGLKVRLQEQPFRVLALLLENTGEVVTRDELREKLWSAETYVDFDKSLNTTVNKLREALGDSAENPRFVQTLHRRGYRFIAPVEGIPQESLAAGQAGSTESESPVVGAKSNTTGHSWKSARFLQTAVVALTVSLMAAVGIILALWAGSPEPGPPATVARFSFAFGSDVREPAISPNGLHIAYVKGVPPASKLWVQDLDREQPRALHGTEGALAPFWSPDSHWIGFITDRTAVKKVSVIGRGPVLLCQLPVTSGRNHSAAWSSDGKAIIFEAGTTARTAFYEVSANGGSPKLLLEPEKPQRITFPQFLPVENGRRVLMFAKGPHPYEIVLYDLSTSDEQVLVRGIRPIYSSSGHIVYQTFYQPGRLWALPFSLNSLEPTGEAFPVAHGAEFPSVSDSGMLVYLDRHKNGWQLVWRDRRGKKLGVVGQPQEYMAWAALSPNERLVAVCGLEGLPDIWLHDVASSVKTRLTSDPALEVGPLWAASGDHIIFTKRGRILLKSIDGNGEATILAEERQFMATSWSPDGKHILYLRYNDQNSGRRELWYLRSTEDSGYDSVPYLQSPFNVEEAQFSPDGGYIAYLLDEGGRRELYVRDFPKGTKYWKISTHGGRQPLWSRDGKELFYVKGDTLMAVTVTTRPDFSFGAKTELFRSAHFRNNDLHNYDVSADGQRFVLPEPVEADEPVVRVVQNWYEEFRDHE